jgi:hypothetical protein
MGAGSIWFSVPGGTMIAKLAEEPALDCTFDCVSWTPSRQIWKTATAAEIAPEVAYAPTILDPKSSSESLKLITTGLPVVVRVTVKLVIATGLGEVVIKGPLEELVTKGAAHLLLLNTTHPVLPLLVSSKVPYW